MIGKQGERKKYKMPYKQSIPKVKERKNNSSKLKPFSIYAHNYTWENNNGVMKLSLGNMTDAGWYWNGNQDDLNSFLIRLKNSKVRENFLEDTKKEEISYNQVKPYLLKSVDKDDGLYEISGDNRVWHFGEIGEPETDFLDEENFSEEQKSKFYEYYQPVTYEEYAKENRGWYREKMKKNINNSKSYEEYMNGLQDIQSEAVEKFYEMNTQKITDAIIKVNKNKK